MNENAEIYKMSAHQQNSVVITVPGTPVAQPRQRHAVRTRKDGSAFAHNYTPKNATVQSYKQLIAVCAMRDFEGPPLRCPVKLTIFAFFPRPQNLVWKTKEMPRLAMQKKPDGDNVLKAIKDALNGICWLDDRLVYDERICRIVCGGNDDPKTVIMLQPMPDGVDLSDLW